MVGSAADAIDAVVLHRWADAAVRTLDAHRAELDALNVFPVADSDTGTNLYLTLREGLDWLGRAGAGVADHQAAHSFARGALVGARGNSGVIVSQYLGALLRSLPTALAPDLLAAALCTATEAAYRAVAHPVEGTVLTVARAVGDGATAAVGSASEAVDVLEAAIDAGYVALARTTAQLAPLRAAGVFDAGAWGLLLVLDALAEALHGPAGRAPRPRPAVPRRCDEHDCVEDVTGGAFEVMYLVAAPERADAVADTLGSVLSAVGDSVAVVGGDGLWQAHVHTDTPLAAVGAADEAGLVASQIRVRHIASQSGVHMHRPTLGLVTVTGAPALAADLARAGAVVVLVPEGSRAGAELVRAIDDTGARTVLVLAADGLLDGASDAVGDAAGIAGSDGVGHDGSDGVGHPGEGADAGPTVRRVDGLSEVQVVAGAATLASLDPALGAAHLAEAVLAAVRAVRTTTVDVGGRGHAERATTAARELLAQPTTLLTVLTSSGTSAEVVDRVAAQAREAGVEVVVLPTGATGDRVVLGAE